MLRLYVDTAGLQPDGGWSVSAVPSWAGPTAEHRFATISGGQTEMFYVWIHSNTGQVTSWGLRLEGPEGDLSALPPGVSPEESRNGDLNLIGTTLSQLAQCLDDDSLRTRVVTTATERADGRRTNWHNPYLAALLAPSRADERASVEPATDEDREIERRYIERVTRTRQHQGPLRQAALKHYAPPACHYCGLAVVEVLDAAHLVPDSSGGAATVSNVRLLCASHHRAFDRELLVWDAGQGFFSPAPDAPIVLPSPQH